MKEVKSKPSINKNSEKIVAMKNSTSPFRVPQTTRKVEDRLLEQHKISKKEHENRIKNEEKMARQNARPNI